MRELDDEWPQSANAAQTVQCGNEIATDARRTVMASDVAHNRRSGMQMVANAGASHLLPCLHWLLRTYGHTLHQCCIVGHLQVQQQHADCEP